MKEKECLLEEGSHVEESTRSGSKQVTQTWRTVCTVLGNMQMECCQRPVVCLMNPQRSRSTGKNRKRETKTWVKQLLLTVFQRRDLNQTFSSQPTDTPMESGHWTEALEVIIESILAYRWEQFEVIRSDT